MRRFLTIALFSVLAVAACADRCQAQVFGNFYPARTVGEAERCAGAYFIVADDVVGGLAQFRYGATYAVDLGLQLGVESVDSYVPRGGLYESADSDNLLVGGDVKFAMRTADSEMPVDISVGFGAGFVDAEGAESLLFSVTGQGGWRGPEPESRGLEPYVGLALMVNRMSVDLPGGGDSTDTDTDLEVRVGTAYVLTRAASLLAELHAGNGTAFAVGVNVTF
jgi:hypothetical protein